MARRAAVAYVDGVAAAAEDGSNRRAGARLPDPLAGRPRPASRAGWPSCLHLGIRWIDVGAAALVMAAWSS